MDHMQDKIVCKGIVCDARIGFKHFEKGITQKIKIDFEAEVFPIPTKDKENSKALKLDYFRAYELIRNFINDKNFKLIETVAEDIAELMLKNFLIEGIKVSIRKRPLDMPEIEDVSYSIYRKKNVS